MKIEILFPEFCNLFGDTYNMIYLEKTLPDAEFIRTPIGGAVRFTEEAAAGREPVCHKPVTEPGFAEHTLA